MLPSISVPPPPAMPEQLLPAVSSAPGFQIPAPTPSQQQQQQFPMMDSRWGQPGMEIAQDPRRGKHVLECCLCAWLFASFPSHLLVSISTNLV